MNLETIRLARNFLLRALVVTFVLNLLMALATFTLWPTWTGLTSQWFHTPPESLGPLMVNFFTTVKFFALFVLLAPAVALHWTLKAETKKLA